MSILQSGVIDDGEAIGELMVTRLIFNKKY